MTRSKKSSTALKKSKSEEVENETPKKRRSRKTKTPKALSSVAQALMDSDEKFKCSFCHKEFSRHATISTHVCMKKERWESRNEKWARIAYSTWKKFYEYHKLNKGDMTVTDFISSQYYTDFAKFGWFAFQTKIVDLEDYVYYLIKSKIKITSWPLEKTYKAWMNDHIKNEPPISAVERSIRFMETWAEEKRVDFNSYFKSVSTSAATAHILDGRVSPWIILTSSTAHELFDRMDEQQLALIHPILNPALWNIKLNRHEDEVVFIRNLLEECGL